MAKQAVSYLKYTKFDVTIYNPQGVPIVRGWRQASPSKLWCMALVPGDKHGMEDHEGKTVPLSAFSAYDLPSVEALVRFCQFKTLYGDIF